MTPMDNKKPIEPPTDTTMPKRKPGTKWICWGCGEWGCAIGECTCDCHETQRLMVEAIEEILRLRGLITEWADAETMRFTDMGLTREAVWERRATAGSALRNAVGRP